MISFNPLFNSVLTIAPNPARSNLKMGVTLGCAIAVIANYNFSRTSIKAPE
jgi:hypothetical protein